MLSTIVTNMNRLYPNLATECKQSIETKKEPQSRADDSGDDKQDDDFQGDCDTDTIFEKSDRLSPSTDPTFLQLSLLIRQVKKDHEQSLI